MGSGFMLSYKLIFSWTISVHKSFTLFFSLLFLQWKPLCGAQEMLQLLVRLFRAAVLCPHAHCPRHSTELHTPLLAALWPLLAIHSKSSTHKSQSLFIYKTSISHVYVPFYTTKECDWSFPLCCVHQKISPNVTMTSCLLTVVYLRLQTLFFYCKWVFPIQMSLCGLCVLQRLLNALTSRFIQLAWCKVKISS